MQVTDLQSENDILKSLRQPGEDTAQQPELANYERETMAARIGSL